VVLIASCNSEPNSPPVDYETFRPKSKEPGPSKQPLKDSVSVDLRCFNQDSVALGILNALAMDTAYFLDRFTSKHAAVHLKLIASNGEFVYGSWSFRDSIARKNAVFNWLDRFGEREISFPWLKSVNLGAKHHLILFNDRSVVALTGSTKPSMKQWLNYQRFNFPKDSVRYVLTSIPNRKCQWHKAINPKKMVLCQP
jgi:hypothetical protein